MTRAPDASPPLRFTVATWNIHRLMPGAKATRDRLLALDADFIALQETTPAWEAFLRPAVDERFAHVEFRHWVRAGGLAILARRPFETIAYIESAAGKYPAWLVEARTPLGPVDVAVVHLHPPAGDDLDFSIWGWLTRGRDRALEMERLIEHRRPDRPTIVLGDFNETKRGRAMRRLVRAGFRNTADLDGHAPSWRLHPRAPFVGARLDHLMFSPRLACADSRVLDHAGSDHAPLHAAFTHASPSPPT
ncbi:MAG: endonuclease/exonuclease/phosphatase family protein [Phycisphaerales bacterium]